MSHFQLNFPTLAQTSSYVTGHACWNFYDFEWHISHLGSGVALLHFRNTETSGGSNGGGLGNCTSKHLWRPVKMAPLWCRFAPFWCLL